MPESEDIRRSIRAEKLRERERISPEERLELSISVSQRLLDLVKNEGWTTVHSYLSFRSEVDTYSLIGQLLAREVRVVVPWVEENGALSHHELTSLEDLSEGPLGVPHPPRNEFRLLDQVEAVLLPLAAFDRSGNRLGYGKGYYDRFLAQLSSGVKRIGLAFAIQEADVIPAMPHDQPLHMIVTEREVIEVARDTTR
jgi:5-formyltetrahydrofolate cyclo-ligase